MYNHPVIFWLKTKTGYAQGGLEILEGRGTIYLVSREHSRVPR